MVPRLPLLASSLLVLAACQTVSGAQDRSAGLPIAPEPEHPLLDHVQDRIAQDGTGGGIDPADDLATDEDGEDAEDPAPPPGNVAGRRFPELRAHGLSRPPTRTPRGPQLGSELARRAASLVGVRSLSEVTQDLPDDCSGFVRLIYDSEAIELTGPDGKPGENAVSNIYRRAVRAGALKQHDPVPGDLVFFRETYDRNRDGRRNDGLTHIGIVEAVAADGTVSFVHHGHLGIARAHLNLRQPREHRSARGEILNDFLRRASGRVRAFTTGELFSAYASPDKL